MEENGIKVRSERAARLVTLFEELNPEERAYFLFKVGLKYSDASNVGEAA
jgi:hypothetical protein